MHQSCISLLEHVLEMWLETLLFFLRTLCIHCIDIPHAHKNNPHTQTLIVARSSIQLSAWNRLNYNNTINVAEIEEKSYDPKMTIYDNTINDPIKLGNPMSPLTRDKLDTNNNLI